MKTLLYAACFAAASAVLPLAGPLGQVHAASVTTPEPEPALEGTWEGLETGREEAGRCILTIQGRTAHFQGANPGEWYKAELSFPAGSNPREMRATITECPFAELVGRVTPAIFKFEAGALVLAAREPGAESAPTSFEAQEGVRRFVFKKG